MKNRYVIALGFGLFVFVFALYGGKLFRKGPELIASPTNLPLETIKEKTEDVLGAKSASAGPAASITLPFYYSFNTNGIIEQTSSSIESSSPYWWLQYGGRMHIEDGVGKTIQGSLAFSDPWRIEYAETHPVDTDNGAHPQNIFRLNSRHEWLNYEQELHFRIRENNESDSRNRGPSNGLTLYSRYQDVNNFYAITLRVDGAITVKKKAKGKFSTLAYKKIFGIGQTYDVDLNPNLLPKNTWLGVKHTVQNLSDGNVRIKVFTGTGLDGNWTQAFEAIDADGTRIREKGFNSIRTDFMDVEFDDYRLGEITTTQPTITPPPPPAQITPPPAIIPPPPAPLPPPPQIMPPPPAVTPPPPPAPVVEAVTSSLYGLANNILLEEEGSAGESASPYWWVNSGAYFNILAGIGRTVQGSLPIDDPWRKIYAASNPYDTDNGFHPQNIFRLVTKTTWQNFIQEGYFRVAADQLSSSSNRAGHNALLFFNRYENGQNLYYTGLRVDGQAVIKKKLGGTYYTMALKKVLSGTYNRTSSPNLIPKNTWIGLRSVVQTVGTSVNIKVYMDMGRTGNWQLIAEAVDNGSTYGRTITSKASAGIRTDFMDVEVTGYRLQNI